MLKTGKSKYKRQEGDFVKRAYAVLQWMWQKIFSSTTEVLVLLERTSSGILCKTLIICVK